jgi:UDP-glucose 4-epimerase
MPSYLVTGGCGFIGTHLCRALLQDGHGVRVLDDLSSGRRENLAAGAELIEGDIADPDCLDAGLAGVEGCFHLAAIASVAAGVADWVGTNRVNLVGTLALFAAIARLPRGARPAVVYASSAAVYGDAQPLPVAETAPPRPLSAYGADKCAMELHAGVATHLHGIPTVGLRFFNVYGPMQDPSSPYSGVISIFCDRLRAGRPITIHGDGDQTRDFVAVADAVAALRAAMRCMPGEASVFNVCTETATSIRALAATIGGLCGFMPDIVVKPARAGEIRHSLGSAARARAALGLGAPTPLRQGLVPVLDWLGAGGFQKNSDFTAKASPAQRTSETAIVAGRVMPGGTDHSSSG